jgi:hypothetical protein
VDIEPIQDLHGYDNPWPAGGGKNKFNGAAVATTNINNWGVAWNDSTNTLTIEHKNAYSSGMPSVDLNLAEGTYVVSGNLSKSIDVYKDGAYMAQLISERTFVAESGHNYSFYFPNTEINTTTYSNLQLELGSTATTFEPYSNICPISGHTQAVVTRTGVNVWDEEWENGRFDIATGNKIGGNGLRTKNLIPVIPNTTYFFTRGDYTGAGSFVILYYDANKSYLSYDNKFGTTTTVTMPVNAYYINVNIQTTESVTTYNHDISINYPATDTDYHEGHVQSINISLGQTVYGGTLDVINGVLTVDMAIWALDSDSVADGGYGMPFSAALPQNAKLTTSGNVLSGTICNQLKEVVQSTTWGINGTFSRVTGIYKFYFKINDDVTTIDSLNEYLALHPMQFAYPIATPLTIQLDPHEVTALLGSNNVWADTGDSAVEYRADPTLYVQRKIAEAISALS